MPKTSMTPIAAALVASLLASPVMAQDTKTASAPVQKDAIAEALRERGEAYRRASDEKQDETELRTTTALNAEILDQNDLAEMQDRANQAAFARAQQEYQAELARVEAERLRIERENAETQERYRLQMEAHVRARADWEACVAGNTARCQTQ